MERIAQIRLQSSGKAHNQAQVGVVLAAIEDTIKASDSPLAPTSYFASLLALLQTCVSGNSITNNETAYAAIYLLDAVVPETSASLLCNQFTQVLNLLVPLLNAEDAATVRSAIGVLQGLLSAQSIESWRSATTVQALKSLLMLALDSRPKIRKRAIEAVSSILKAAPVSLAKDAIATDIVAEELLKSASSQVAQNDQSALLHTLQLIKSVASAVSWPVKYVDQLCDILLKGVSELGEGFVTVTAFEVFERVFEQGSQDVDLVRLQSLLQTIVGMKPNDKDANVLPPWLNVIARGYELYSKTEPDSAAAEVGTIFKSIFPFLQSELAPVRKTCSDCLQSLIVTCLRERKSTPAVQAIVTTTLRGLNSGARYRAARSEMFDIVRSLFDKLKSKANPILMESLTVLAESRKYVHDKTQIDAVFGAAIRAVGPAPFFKVLPLDLTSGSGRAWLLPILRDHVQNTELDFFVKELVPLSETFFPKTLGEDVDAKIFQTVIDQIWSSLPGFCDLPLDLPTALTPEIAELLATVLYKQPDLRVTVCNALQNLCLKPQQLLDSELSDDVLTSRFQYTREKASGDLKHMKQFAGNFLSVLFNVYSQTLPNYRGNILSTIKAFFTVADSKDISSAFAKVIQTLDESMDVPATGANAGVSEGMPPVKHTAMDLIIAFVPHLDPKSADLLWEIFVAQVSNAQDAVMQKKAYKIFNALADAGLALKKRADQVQTILLANKGVATSVRRDRLHALINMVNLIPREDLHFIPAILSEAVLCTKEQNERARLMAFDLLVLMGERMKAGGKVKNSLVDGMKDAEDAEASIQEYFVMVQAGLASPTPHMVSATVTALARLLFEFQDDLSPTFIVEMLDAMEPILESKNREIARAALGFYKVVVISLPTDLVVSRLQSLVAHLVGWSHEHSRDFKSKVKHLLERMVRRYGFDLMERHIPDADKKLLANIRKQQERKKRAKREEGENADAARKLTGGNAFDDAMQESDESEEEVAEEEEVTVKQRGKRRPDGRGEAYIQHTDEPMDLLDKSALSQVSSTRPDSATAKPKALPSARSKFKQDLDGKYIFNEKGEPKAEAAVEGSSGMGALVESRQGMKKNSKGRVRFSNKRQRDDDEDDDGGDLAGDAEKKLRLSEGAGRKGDKGRAPVSSTKKLFTKGAGGKSLQAGGRKTRK
ncbi:armadillo-type protein [Protomyces lactucae-debilis]|uniref:Armadillo-type protein n=1 Tax=Protomyces lactucae-debilis TaxID=2754530 RepID=A0A1Y2FC42_PROLT|nr:armadillo-type protein [Protomyces lactucae-debilis]ORY80896.1 armadillo-type protein [Protomyces lactucae-debilis]